MPTPYLRLAVESAPMNVALNLSALTSRAGTFSMLDGASGADWMFQTHNNPNPNRKREGGDQLYFRPFADSGSVPNSLSEITFPGPTIWSLGDDCQSDATDEAVMASPPWGGEHCGVWGMPANVINCGMRCAPNADQAARSITMFVALYGGSYTLSGALSDGSAPTVAQSLAAGTDGTNYRLRVDYRAVVAGSTLALEFRRTAVDPSFYSGVGGVGVKLAWMPVPESPPVPRFFRAIQMIQSTSGGANA